MFYKSKVIIFLYLLVATLLRCYYIKRNIFMHRDKLILKARLLKSLLLCYLLKQKEIVIISYSRNKP